MEKKIIITFDDQTGGLNLDTPLRNVIEVVGILELAKASILNKTQAAPASPAPAPVSTIIT